MKFLVLALCVCAASAASFGSFGSRGGYKPYQAFSSVAAPAQVAAQAAAEVAAPVVAPVVVPAAKVAAAVYQPAQQVVTKTVPYAKEAEAVVLRSESDISPEGYSYSYETSNGITSNVVGSLKTVGDETVLVSQGAYKYVGPDGTPVYVTFTADENGFQPQSDLLPVAPPVPEAIARSLAYIAARTTGTVQKNYN